MGVGWNTFTGHVGTEPDWDNPGNAHDDDMGTFAASPIIYDYELPGWLYVTCEPVAVATQVRFYMERFWGWVFPMYRIQVEVDGTWLPPVEGEFGGGPGWRGYSFSAGNLTRARIKFFKLYIASSFRAVVWESQFYTPDFWPPPIVTAGPRTYFFLA